MPAISDSTRLALGLVVAVCVLILLPIVYDIAKGEIKFLPNRPVLRWLLFGLVGTLAVFGTVLASSAPSIDDIGAAEATITDEPAETVETGEPATLAPTDIPSPTPEPSATAPAGPTPTATPAPTNRPNTLPGTLLELGDSFRYENVLMTVAEINIQPGDDCSIGISFRFDNLSSTAVSLNLRDLNFTLTDNLSGSWRRAGLSTSEPCPAASATEEFSETLEPGQKSPASGGYYTMGFLGPIDAPGLQYIVFEVAEMPGFGGAKWTIQIEQ